MANYALFFTFISFLLGMVSAQRCQNFDHYPQKIMYRCKPECLVKGKIEGTTIYSPQSSICSAAVHAGVIDPSEKHEKVVYYSKTETYENFVGSVRNRRVSKSQHGNDGYWFTSKKFIPHFLNEESWMTDVYLIHNNYIGSFTSSGESYPQLWVACLWDSNSTEDSKIEIFRWDHQRFDGDGRSDVFYDKSKKKLEVYSYYFNNLRAFNCHGKHPYSDVFGIFLNYRHDKYIAEKVSNVGSLGEKLTVKMRNYTNKLVSFRRFPDDKPINKKPRLPLHWETLKETDNALYSVGELKNDKEFTSDSAYFEIIVKECTDNKYGEKCSKTCQSCENGGVCHPVIGSCICRAGFYGARCDKRCPLNSFGSNCQFSCSWKYLGNKFTRYKKNCLGLTFCLPKPLGCSCAFGYEGFLCNEFSNLTFPFFNRTPSVRLTTLDSEIEIEFEEWKEGVDPGSSFGLKISYYSIFISVWGEIKISPTKVIKTRLNITAGQYYEIKIWINLKDFDDTRRPKPEKSPVTKVSLPCFVEDKDRKLDVIKQERETLQFSYNIPPKQIDFKGCSFKLTLQSANQNKKIFSCPNNTESSTVLCQFGNLPTGTDFEIDVSCENKIGRCSSTKMLTFTFPNIEEFLTYSYPNLTVQKFANFEKTNISVRKLRNEADIEHLLSLQPQEIKSITEPLAERDNFEWNKEDQMFSLSLEKDIQKSGKPFHFVVLFQAIKQNNQDYYKSVSKVFLSSDTITKGYIYVIIFIIVILLLLLVVIIFLRKRIQKTKVFKNIFVEKPVTIPDFEISAPTSSAKNSKAINKPTENDEDKLSSYTNDGIIVRGNVVNDDTKVLFRKDKGDGAFNHEIGNDGYLDYENIRNSSSFEDGLEIYLNSLINSPKTTEAFYSVPKDCGKPCTIATHPMNKMKNRYKNNLAYDDTRVVLSLIDNDPYSDYINANLMNGLNNRKWYISTQGPKDSNQNTIGDFWRMIVEARISFIIMVANFYEKGKLKVGEYFREGDVLEFNGIYVAVLERLQHPHFIRSVIQVTYSTSDLKTTAKDVVHYQFIKWPDHGVPSQIFPLVFMVQNILQEFKEGGIVIHCSAGIGRTGTILLVLLLKEYQEASTWIDPISVLRNMRETRASLVENIHQFNLSLLLLYECIFGKLGSLYANEVDSNWAKYLNESGKLFERLMKQPILHTYTFGENNIDLNRNPAILPSDNHVIFYGNNDISKNSDYLNSISIDIEDMLNSVIVTEHPLSSTLYNFWKMIFEKKCSYLCLLNFIEPSEDFPSILPLEERVADFGDLALHVESVDGSFRFSSTQYIVTLSSRESSHSVNVIQLLDWKPEEEYPASLSQLEGIISFVKDKANSKAPVVVCCSDGVTACGLVTSAVNVINRIDVYQELNIYNSVLRIRRCRPEFLTSKNQFMKIYEVAYLYIENNASYQNFQ